MNDFEQRLQNQSPRRIPELWRREILAAAHAAAPSAASPSSLLRSLLWPHPRAWAGLAALWIVIVGLHTSANRPDGGSLVARSDTPSRASTFELASLSEQRRLQRELLDLTPVPVSPPTARPKLKTTPKPQSANRPIWGEA